MIKIYKFSEVDKNDLFIRSDNKTGVADTVEEIIENVKTNGDKALLEYCEKFDGVMLTNIEVTEKEFYEAYKKVDIEFIEVIQKAMKNIYDFHTKQVRQRCYLRSTYYPD